MSIKLLVSFYHQTISNFDETATLIYFRFSLCWWLVRWVARASPRMALLTRLIQLPSITMKIRFVPRILLSHGVLKTMTTLCTKFRLRLINITRQFRHCIRYRIRIEKDRGQVTLHIAFIRTLKPTLPTLSILWIKSSKRLTYARVPPLTSNRSAPSMSKASGE